VCFERFQNLKDAKIGSKLLSYRCAAKNSIVGRQLAADGLEEPYS
jgi:hypothetical protein